MNGHLQVLQTQGSLWCLDSSSLNPKVWDPEPLVKVPCHIWRHENQGADAPGKEKIDVPAQAREQIYTLCPFISAQALRAEWCPHIGQSVAFTHATSSDPISLETPWQMPRNHLFPALCASLSLVKLTHKLSSRR